MNINQYIQIAILLISILLIGCSKPIEIECENNTIYKTIYNTTIKEVFIDRPGNCSNETIFISSSNNTCDLSLINQINLLENIINKWALIDINITVNETNTTEVNST